MIRIHHNRGLRSLVLAAAAVTLLVLPARGDEFTFAWGHPSPQGNPVHGLAFASSLEGWAVGGSGFVLHTVDGGAQWSLQHGPLAVSPDLYDILLTSAGTLIACGAGEGLYRSVDGGATWSAPPHPPASDLRDLFLVPGGAISAAGDTGVVLVSTDDGLSWSSRGPGTGTIRHHCWRTAVECYVVGKDIQQRTTDGGTTWSPFIDPEFFGYNEVYFADAQHGYVVADFEYWSTSDGGASWTEHPTFVSPLYRYRTLPLDATHWLSVCHGEGGELWETTNAGVDWTLHQTGGSVGFPCLVRAPGGRIIYGADTGDIYYSDDLGATVVDGVDNLGGEATGAQIMGLHRRPDGVLFAANQPTSLETPAWLRSDDGGRTWFVPAQTPGLYWAFAGSFFDNQRGVVGDQEQIRATFDGGASWQNASLPLDHSVSDFATPAADRYFASTYRGSGSGGVFRSSDGGLSWTVLSGGLPSTGINYSAIGFPTSSTGYAAGYNTGGSSRIYRTTDGGSSWQQLAATGLSGSVRSMIWFDASRGVVSVTGSSTGIFRTQDGGQTYSQVLAGTFVRLSRGGAAEAVGTSGIDNTMLHTTDSGLTWQAVSVPVRGPFPGMNDYLACAAPVDGGWAIGAGRNRIILALRFPTSDAQAQTGGDSARRVWLSADANPTRGATTLRYRLSEAGHVRLDLFAPDGALVTRLLEDDLPAGSGSIAWDGHDAHGRPLPRGVYFAALRTASGARTLKLTLLP